MKSINFYVLIGSLFLLSDIRFALSEENIKQLNAIDDFSNLNRTLVHDIKYPKDYQELAKILADAQKNNLKISIAGKKHSQGGHTFYKMPLS